MYAEAVAEQSSKKRKVDKGPEDIYHPPRRGYTREVEKIDDLTDNIIALRAEMGKWRPSSTRYTPRPLFPTQAVEEMMRHRARTIRDTRIRESQERWRKRHGGTGA